MTLPRYLYRYEWRRHRIGEMPEAIESPDAAYRLLQQEFETAETERLVVLLLNRKHRPIGVETLYSATLTGGAVRIAEVFRAAVRLNAAALIVAHNHPSGDPTPSAEDLRTTRDAVSAGRLLGIEMLDHLVFGNDGYVSIGSLLTN